MASCLNPALNGQHVLQAPFGQGMPASAEASRSPCASQPVTCTSNCSALQEALLALNEAVRVAQQNSDNGVLAESLAALCQLLAATTPQAAGRMGGLGGADVAARHHLQLLKLLRRQGHAALGVLETRCACQASVTICCAAIDAQVEETLPAALPAVVSASSPCPDCNLGSTGPGGWRLPRRGSPCRQHGV